MALDIIDSYYDSDTLGDLFITLFGGLLIWYATTGMRLQCLHNLRKQYPKELGRIKHQTFSEGGIDEFSEDSGDSVHFNWASVDRLETNGTYYYLIIESRYLLVDANGFSGDGRAAFERFADQFIGRHTSDTTTG